MASTRTSSCWVRFHFTIMTPSKGAVQMLDAIQAQPYAHVFGFAFVYLPHCRVACCRRTLRFPPARQPVRRGSAAH